VSASESLASCRHGMYSSENAPHICMASPRLQFAGKALFIVLIVPPAAIEFHGAVVMLTFAP